MTQRCYSCRQNKILLSYLKHDGSFFKKCLKCRDDFRTKRYKTCDHGNMIWKCEVCRLNADNLNSAPMNKSRRVKVRPSIRFKPKYNRCVHNKIICSPHRACIHNKIKYYCGDCKHNVSTTLKRKVIVIDSSSSEEEFLEESI